MYLSLQESSYSKGGESAAIKAEESFKLVATMNPRGDYGKKELSPALRNRFTDLWWKMRGPRVDR
jgi:midasin